MRRLTKADEEPRPDRTLDSAVILGTLLQSRSAFIEFVIAAIAIALSIEFLATGALEALGLQAGWTLAIGCVLAIGSLSFLAWRLFAQRTKSASLQGFFLYDVRDNSLVPKQAYNDGHVRSGAGRRRMARTVPPAVCDGCGALGCFFVMLQTRTC